MGLELYLQFRRRKMRSENNASQEFAKVDPKMLQEKVNQLEKAQPVPVDFIVDKDTRVVLISGPNMGGKTVCLKTLGLAAMMAKAGLYILCSEPAKIPWFDYVLADIGDQQSLSHSLSTFSGHLKQISDIQSKSTSQSLVLLDEIGAGTNPLEGTALGMSILESFSVSGALLTVATTHHGELKTLKYCNEAFENACMEYDEVHLKPTYKIVWGIPGHSRAINIAERLGMLELIVTNARNLYGAASAEVDEVIFDLEKSRQDVEVYVRKTHHYLVLSKDLREKLLLAQRKLSEPRSKLSNRRMQQISEIASRARSSLHKTMRQYQASAHNISKPVQPPRSDLNPSSLSATNQHSAANISTSALIYGGEPCITVFQYPVYFGIVEGAENKSSTEFMDFCDESKGEIQLHFAPLC